jgi:hypothetical protein
MVKTRKRHRVLVVITPGNRQPWKSMHRQENNIKVVLAEIGSEK